MGCQLLLYIVPGSPDLFGFLYLILPLAPRINRVDRVLPNVDVRIPTQPTAEYTLYGIPADEPSRNLPVPSRPHLVQVQRRIELFAAEQVIVRG